MDFLISHRITEMSDPNEQWPTLACPKRELELRLTMFKKEGLHLLYRLADCAGKLRLFPSRLVNFVEVLTNLTAGLKSKSSIRVRQATFLENQLRAEVREISPLVWCIFTGPDWVKIRSSQVSWSRPLKPANLERNSSIKLTRSFTRSWLA